MSKVEFLRTERLSLCELSLDDAAFMFTLMNTSNWKEFIGDRSIHSLDDTRAYIQRIIDTSNTTYWVIQQNDNQKLIGIISFMKRDYLEHYDIGFALLPNFFGKGFAFEATSAVLAIIKKDKSYETVLATTVPSNINSIQLLERLGFSFRNKIHSNEEALHVYNAHFK